MRQNENCEVMMIDEFEKAVIKALENNEVTTDKYFGEFSDSQKLKVDLNNDAK